MPSPTKEECLKVLFDHTERARMYDHRKHPFIWNVKMNDDYSFKRVFTRMAKDHYVCEADAIVSIPSKEGLEIDWEDFIQRDSSVPDSVLEDMRRTFTEDDTMKFVTPEREEKWGVKAPEDRRWDTKFSFEGRSGGWLSLVQFRDVDLLRFQKNSGEWSELDEEWLRSLCAMCEEIEYMVSQRHEEYVYLLAYQMFTTVLGNE